MGKSKMWEHVAFADIRIGDVLRRTTTFRDGTVKTLTGPVRYKGLVTASTEDGFILARAEDKAVVVQRRVVKPKLPLEPGTVIDAEVVRSWRQQGGMPERREIRLIRGRAHWVGMEHATGWQFIAEDKNIKKWTLVAAPAPGGV